MPERHMENGVIARLIGAFFSCGVIRRIIFRQYLYVARRGVSSFLDGVAAFAQFLIYAMLATLCETSESQHHNYILFGSGRFYN